jgi:hypothetical protein
MISVSREHHRPPTALSPAGRTQSGHGLEIDRLLCSVLALLGGDIDASLEELGVMERVTIGPKPGHLGWSRNAQSLSACSGEGTKRRPHRIWSLFTES